MHYNIAKFLHILCFSSFITIWLIGHPSQINAQFIGFKADVAIAYSTAPGGVSGGSFGIIHPAPFFPNIGYSALSFEDVQEFVDPNQSTSSVKLTTTTSIKTINFFYYVPFPVVTISIGIGIGQDNLNTGMETKTYIEETYQNSKQTPDNSDLKKPVSESFIHIGLPFWNTIEFHLGYHLMSVSTIDLISKKSNPLRGSYSIDNKNYTGGMTTVGIQVAF